METRHAIQAEIGRLSSWFKREDEGFAEIAESTLLDEYVEIVLCEDRIELVLGGQGREAEMQALAAEFGFSAEVISAFGKFAERFPHKMLYMKFVGRSAAAASSMYFVLIEPWAAVAEVLASLSFSASVLDELNEAVGSSRICFLFGFTFDPSRRRLAAKAYVLGDLAASAAVRKPFLISHRFSRTDFDPIPKIYYARAAWSEFDSTPAWKQVAQLGLALFSDRFEILKGDDGNGKFKAYVFRHDRREGDSFSLKSYNYYVDEATRLISLDDMAAAERSLRNAVEFAPKDADALNRLGYVIMMQGRHLEGIQSVLRAKQLDPDISNLIWNETAHPAGMDAELEFLDQSIACSPQAADLRNRAIIFFLQHRYAAAREDLLRAIELEPTSSESYDKLGGIYLKLGDFGDAINACMTAHSINPGTNPSNLKIAKQVLSLQNLVEQSQHRDAYVALGKLYYRLDHFEMARDCFQQAAELESLTMREQA